MNAFPKSYLVFFVGVFLAVLFSVWSGQLVSNSRIQPPPTLEETALMQLVGPPAPPAPSAPPAPPEEWLWKKVKSGDNLARIFQRLKLPAADLQQILALGGQVSTLRKIMPEEEIGFLFADDRLAAIRYRENPLETLEVRRRGKTFSATLKKLTAEKVVVPARGTISRNAPSLYHAGKQAGLSDNIILQLSYLFQWDISFALDLRRGDTFSLLYEELQIDGDKVQEGEIVAASFTNRRKTFYALRYTQSNGKTDYYTPDGRSTKKTFIRDPVHFSYVSSSFNPRRLHPIHKRVMPHRGIDYAAKKGTPVVAAGTGKVIRSRRNRSAGKHIVLQHGEQYVTKYLHLSDYANGVKEGRTVSQGQIIGYVGATGWATGPHLHYEFLVNGVHRNPRRVKLPKAKPVPDAEMERFRQAVLPILAQLNAVAKVEAFPPDKGG